MALHDLSQGQVRVGNLLYCLRPNGCRDILRQRLGRLEARQSVTSWGCWNVNLASILKIPVISLPWFITGFTTGLSLGHPELGFDLESELRLGLGIAFHCRTRLITVNNSIKVQTYCHTKTIQLCWTFVTPSFFTG